jgi:YVTN family beta-propeller protein
MRRRLFWIAFGLVLTGIPVIVAILLWSAAAGVRAGAPLPGAAPASPTPGVGTVGSPPVGAHTEAIAVGPDGTWLYAITPDAKGIALVDLSSNAVQTRLSVEGEAQNLALTGDGSRLYVTTANAVAVIDTASNTVAATVPVQAPTGGVAVAPDDRHVYVTSTDQHLYTIDTSTNTVTGSIAISETPGDVAISHDGTHAYVTDPNVNRVTVVDLAAHMIEDTVAVGTLPFDLALSPDGSHLYVANGWGDVAVMDTTRNDVVSTVQVGGSPLAIAVTPNGTRVCVTNGSSSEAQVDAVTSTSVSVIDPDTNTVVAHLPLPAVAYSVQFSPDSTRAYAALYNGDLAVVDAVNTSLVTTVSMG